MADFKTSILYLGIAAGVGFGIGRVSAPSRKAPKSEGFHQSARSKNVSSARKKKNKIMPVSSQAPAIPLPGDGRVASVEAPDSPQGGSKMLPPSGQKLPQSGGIKSLDVIPPKPASMGPNISDAGDLNEPELVQTMAEKSLESQSTDPSGTPPKVRLYNAYRTRTFWTLGKIAADDQVFTIFIEREEGKNPAFKPRIDWQVGKNRGTIWGDSTRKTQMISLPPEAWRIDRPSVEIGLRVGAAIEGRDFVGATENANLTIKSLSEVVGVKGGVIHISETARPVNAGPGWVTSWNKVAAGPGATSIYVAPGTNISSIWPMLSTAGDFKVEPGVVPQGPMEIFVSQDKVLMGVVSGKISPQTRALIQKNREIVLSYRGLPQDYLGALQWDAASLADRVKTKAIGDVVVLFRAVPGQPFGAVKRDLVTVPNIALLRKEGIALFTKPVENVSYLAH